MNEAKFYYDPHDWRRSFDARVPTPPPDRLVKLCPDGMARRFTLTAAIHDRQGDYTRIDYRRA
jgi:hypothetical protein